VADVVIKAEIPIFTCGIPSRMVAFLMTTTMPLRMYLSSRPTWRDRSRTRRSLLSSLVFRLLNLIQLGLHVGQCPQDLPPRFVLIL
jgi:hypothetical protein